MNLRPSSRARAIVGPTGLCTGIAAALALGPGCDDGAAADSDTVAADTLDAVDTTARPDAPTPWIYPEDATEVTPSLSKATLAAAIDVAMDAALDVEPQVIATLHAALFPMPEAGTGDPTGCPFYLTYDYGNAKAYYWQGECTAADGTRFSGSGYVSAFQDFADEFGNHFTGFDLSMAGRIEAADGTWLEGSGQAASYRNEVEDAAGLSLVLDGTFGAGGPRAPQSPWLDGSRRPTLHVDGWIYIPTGGTNVTVTGGLSGLDFPDGVSAVSLDGLTAREALAGASCQKELGGGAGVRGDDGNWYDVYFDGPVDDEGETPADLCDGCGETWFRGRTVDATCVPANPYFKWIDAPVGGTP